MSTFMKKVRFETPEKPLKFPVMNEFECHSPRPFSQERASIEPPSITTVSKILPYSPDPVQRFESSNSFPYPVASATKTYVSGLNVSNNVFKPSNDLDLSMLDSSHNVPRLPLTRTVLKSTENIQGLYYKQQEHYSSKTPVMNVAPKTIDPPNILTKHDDFFLQKNNIDLYHIEQFQRLSIDKENDCKVNNNDFLTRSIPQTVRKQPVQSNFQSRCTDRTQDHHQDMCHCTRGLQNIHCITENGQYLSDMAVPRTAPCCIPTPKTCPTCDHRPKQHKCNPCHCHTPADDSKLNAVDKKTWAIDRYEQNNGCNDLEMPNGLKEKREPTVSDLFKIIKLQNEQLQLLQEKVDRFLSGANNVHLTNTVQQQDTIQSNDHKISIGVMTSFEMVQTSTIINKEVIMQTRENSQIQCNRSQISIKEVVSKTPSSGNFLDGLIPLTKNTVGCTQSNYNNGLSNNGNEEKTLNELSLYNVQVDNATTPMMSPEPSLCLDVRDYSDSDVSSNDQSNVGWTYYNKVMTHVNGMLQESDMPSSASALYRNTRQCVQMQIDKTNVSVTKRVKFGDDPFGVRQPHIYTPPTDTSFKMNQLAAKYLKEQPPCYKVALKGTAPVDMSLATRNYMERHKILQGVPVTSKCPLTEEMPRFLDITALKQQPKLL